MSEIDNKDNTSKNEYFKYNCPHCTLPVVFRRSDLRFKIYDGYIDSEPNIICPHCRALIMIIANTYSYEYNDYDYTSAYSDTIHYKELTHISKDEYLESKYRNNKSLSTEDIIGEREDSKDNKDNKEFNKHNIKKMKRLLNKLKRDIEDIIDYFDKI